MTRLSLAFLVLFLAAQAQAEMDHSDYEVPPLDVTPEEAAADRARAETETKARRIAQEAETARLTARPLGEQLIDLRCAMCHSADTYRQADLGWLGWQVTVWRMDLLNGAGVERGEHRVIANQLYVNYPPTGGRAAMEWLSLLLICVALPLPWAFWRRRKRNTHTG